MNTSRRFACIEPLEGRIAPAFAAVIELSALTGSNGFTIHGVATGNLSGSSVSDAGDVNGDGFGDVIIGAPDASPNGAAYVVFGKASGFGAALELSTLDGTNGFKLSGVAAGDQFGNAVSGAGDVNDDGFADVIIGAVGAGSGRGASYVVFGKADFSATAGNLNVSSLGGTDGFKLTGAVTNDASGRSVSSAGDVNGDGFADVIIGADGFSSERGTAYVVFGKASGFAANLNLSTLNGTNGFGLRGVEAYEHFGISVSNAGDMNGDGFDDLFVGAEKAGANGVAPGAGYVIFGRSGFGSLVLVNVWAGAQGFKISGVADGNLAGHSGSGAGDLNGDGFDDLIIGAPSSPYGAPSSGASYVVFGASNLATKFASNLKLSTLNGTTGFKISGVAVSDGAGSSVSGVGDVNGDGFDDLLIGAADADPHGDSSGASYVVFGKASGFTANLSLSTLNSANGFKLSGVAAGNGSGVSVSGAGDVNGDGFADLLIGAPFAAPHGSYSGASYVIFGGLSLGTLSTDGKTATFTDVDGDLVTVKTTVGTLDGSNFSFAKVPGGVPGGLQLSQLDLSDAEFAGANITITAKRGASGGDGLVNLGFLDATGVDLGAFSLGGDLGHFTLGDGTGPSATSLTLSSMGVYGTSTQVGITPSLTSTVAGSLPTLTISGDVGGITFNAHDLGTVKIAGSVESATFGITGGITSLTVGGDFLGSALTVSGTSTMLKFSGSVEDSNATLGVTTTLTIGDDLRGSTFIASSIGSIVPGSTLGSYKILGGFSVLGGVEGSTIYAAGNIATLTIAGEVSDVSTISAAGGFGSIAPGATPGSVKLNGGLFLNGTVSGTDLISGADIATLSVARSVNTTNISVDGDVGSVKFARTVKSLGFLAGGEVATMSITGNLLASTIEVAGDIGKITAGTTPASVKISGGVSVTGSIIDSSIKTDGDLAKLSVGRRLDSSVISARGSDAPVDAVAAQTIGAIAVAGRVKNTSILAGYDRTFGEAMNADVQIGKVTVGTHWIASNLIAGTTSGVDEIFGTADDALADGGNSIVSKIASVVITGHVRGTVGGLDGFGFVAQEIGAFSASATALPLTAGASNNLTAFGLGSTFDTRLHEVA